MLIIASIIIILLIAFGTLEYYTTPIVEQHLADRAAARQILADTYRNQPTI
mgnify:CR=1 FL=1